MSDRRSEAEALWQALELEDGDQVVEAILVAKVANFTSGGTAVSIGATDGMDWIGQLGLIEAARKVTWEDPLQGRE